MKYDYVEYFSEENHIPNTTKVRLIMLKIMKFLINYWSIVGCSAKLKLMYVKSFIISIYIYT